MLVALEKNIVSQSRHIYSPGLPALLAHLPIPLNKKSDLHANNP